MKSAIAPACWPGSARRASRTTASPWVLQRFHRRLTNSGDDGGIHAGRTDQPGHVQDLESSSPAILEGRHLRQSRHALVGGTAMPDRARFDRGTLVLAWSK